MSQENMEIVREVHEGLARGDFRVAADRLAPGFEWHDFPQAVESATRRGAEVEQGLRDVLDVYENLRVESEEFIDAGDKVVVLGRTYASAKGSGLKLDLPVALVWTVQACKLARLDAFTERSDALAAAGLKE
jgi:ketosteroid isomerase-like protein